MVKFLHISANNLSFLHAITVQMTKTVSEGAGGKACRNVLGCSLLTFPMEAESTASNELTILKQRYCNNCRAHWRHQLLKI